MTLIIDIKVVPQSGRSECILEPSGRIKVYLKSPAQDNKANAELIKYLSKLIGCPQSDLSIVQGALSRLKKIKIEGAYSFQEIQKLLGCEVQLGI